MIELLSHIESQMPNTFKYHGDEIKAFLEFLEEAENSHKSYWCMLRYSEKVQMEFCYRLAERIKNELVLNRSNAYDGFSLQKQEPKDEYERALFCCLGLIYHIQHCMNPG